MKTFPYFNNPAAQANMTVSHYQAKYSIPFKPGYTFSHQTYNESWMRPKDNTQAGMEIARLSPTFVERYMAKAALNEAIRQAVKE